MDSALEVTARVARRLGKLYQLFVEREKRTNGEGCDDLKIQRFLLQCVLAMFAQAYHLLPRDLFTTCVQDCLEGASSYDILGGLFREMNQPGITPAGRYKGVGYFNGDLYSEVYPQELLQEELKLLDGCAREDWSNVRPSIFGERFKETIESGKQGVRGTHFTPEVLIRQVVRPTISGYWEARIESASNSGQLNALLSELKSYQVLDPVCGCGSFLCIAYEELQRIERVLLDKIAECQGTPITHSEKGFVTPLQFHGMDTDPFAVQLTQVMLMVERIIAINKQGMTESVLPLDKLDRNIVRRNALFDEWPKVDAVIGKPPFVGGHRIRYVLGDKEAERLFNKFSEVPGQIDLSSYYFRLAHDHIGESGRAGLITTNTISQGKSRKATLDYIIQNGGYIHEAITNYDWSGEADVYVSIVNWSRKEPQTYYLDNCVVPRINSSLKSTEDISLASQIEANINRSFIGVQPNGKGFIVTRSQVNEWLEADSKNQEVLKLFSSADDLARLPNGIPSRWIIDFNDMDIEQASNYKLPFAHVETHVKPERDKNREALVRKRWWRFRRTSEAMREALSALPLYFSIPCHSKWFIFIPACKDWLPGNSTAVVASHDFYVLGILTSNAHRTWVKALSSTLKKDIRYTPSACFETFPFPQTPDSKLVQDIRDAMSELHEYRAQQMEKKYWGITQLYNQFFDEPSSQLHKLHSQLDQLVMQAYEFSPNSDDDILEQLLKLNLELAEKEKQKKFVVGPWSPTRQQM
jgi:hypothetical protein